MKDLIPKINQLLRTGNSANVLLALQLAKSTGWNASQVAKAWYGHYNSEQYLGLDIIENTYSILHTPLALGIIEYEVATILDLNKKETQHTDYFLHLEEFEVKKDNVEKHITSKVLDADIVLELLERMIEVYYKKYDN